MSPAAGNSGTPHSLSACARKRIEQLKSLPTTVSVAVRLFELGRGDDADAGEYARVIGSDAGLSARLLSVANSPWAGLRNKITRPIVAISLLGTPLVRTLAINFCLSGLHNELHLTRDESRGFWLVSMCKAIAARRVAQLIEPGPAGIAAGEEAYVAGLLQDVALPIMFCCDRQAVAGLLGDANLDNPGLIAGERALFGVDHAELGKLLAGKLGLSESHAQMIGSHHDAALLRLPGIPPAVAQGASAAALFPHRLDLWRKGEAQALRALLEKLPGNPSAESLLAAVATECAQAFAYFDDGKVTELKLVELLARATSEAAEEAVRLVSTVREMAGQVASADQTVARMMETQERLEQQVTRDPLTQTLNRAGFQQQGKFVLRQLQQAGQPAAILYLDVDRFKSVNDTCGHAVGDEALRLVADAMRTCTRGTDLLARVGGDEFVLLLPNCPEAKTGQIAERLRQLVATHTLKRLDGGAQSLSISVGILHLANAGDAGALDLHINEADRRMYEAKRAGGNRIHTHTAAAPTA